MGARCIREFVTGFEDGKRGALKRPAVTPNRLQAGCAEGCVCLQRTLGIGRRAVPEWHTNTRMGARCIREFVTGFEDGASAAR